MQTGSRAVHNGLACVDFWELEAAICGCARGRDGTFRQDRPAIGDKMFEGGLEKETEDEGVWSRIIDI